MSAVNYKGDPLGFGLAFKNPKVLTRGGRAWLRATGVLMLILITYTMGRTKKQPEVGSHPSYLP